MSVLQQIISSINYSESSAIDAYFKNVSFLMNNLGSNNSTNNSFIDSGPNNYTITRNGNVTQGSFAPFNQSGWSVYFTGLTTYLTAPVNSALQLGTSDFTVEFFANPSSYATNQVFVGNAVSIGGGDAQINIWMNTSGQVVLAGWTTTYMTTSTSLTKGIFNHVAIVREGSSLAIFINGTRSATTTASPNFSSSNAMVIGREASGSAPFLGFISNLRIIKGSAIYSPASLTLSVPTSDLTNIANTSLLTCQNRNIKDNSSNNFTLTPGTTSGPMVFPSSPFAPTSAYSSSVNGSSAYFDGGGDYLNTPASGQFNPSGDFTIGSWIYCNALSGGNTVIGNYTTNTGTDWGIGVSDTGVLQFQTNGATVRIQSASGAVKPGQWHYVAMTRTGSTITGWLDGVSQGTYVQAGSFGSASKSIRVGCNVISGSPAEFFDGFISDTIMVDGTSITSVPSAPSTSVSGTNLLLKYENAGVIDVTGRNLAETAGDAKVSTSITKFGNSVVFDGTGDIVFTTKNSAFTIGTGDFTLECWVYMTSTGDDGIVQIGTGFGTNAPGYTNSVGFFRGVTGGATGHIVFINNNTFTIGSVIMTLNAWHHVAVARSGTTHRLFVDGVQAGSVTDSTNYTGNQLMIGAAYGTNYDMAGNITNVRFTKGVARYTANFTPPTEAFPFQ